MHFRFASEKDAPRLLAIYGQYIETPITFQCTLPTVHEFADRIAHISAFYPYIVAEENGEILGYAYAHRHMEREAYQWNAELSVYLDQNATSHAIGTQLVTKIIALLRLQGIKKLVSGITQPNPKSDGLHSKLSFKLVGTYTHAGFKNRKWYDVSWFENKIGEHALDPVSPVSLSELPQEEVSRILND